MPDQRISDLTTLGARSGTDYFVVVEAASGVTKKEARSSITAGIVSDTAYASSWNGVTDVAPSKNAIYDEIELVKASVTASVSDAVYGAGWDGVTTIAPSKNAVYDKIELLDSLVVHKAGAETITGEKTFSADISISGLGTQIKNSLNPNNYIQIAASVLSIQADSDMLINTSANVNINGDSSVGLISGTDIFLQATTDIIVSSVSITPDRVPYIDADNKIITSSVTSTELGYLSGVTSAIQTQLDGKLNKVISGDDLVYLDRTQPSGALSFKTHNSDDDFAYIDLLYDSTVQTAAIGVVDLNETVGLIATRTSSSVLTLSILDLRTITKGLEYLGDYGAGFGNRSLIDRGYGDSRYGQLANPLSQFASTTSAQLAGVISDETGTGALVFATSPTLVTPILGVASATSINLLDTTYKTALDVSSSNVVRLGNGFTTLIFGSGSSNLSLVLNSSTTAFSSDGPVSWSITGSISTAFAINRNNSTSAATNFIGLNVFGTYAPTASGVGTYKGINLSNFTINQTGTSNQTITMIDVIPTLTRVQGTMYGIRLGLGAAPTGGGTTWNIFADGTALSHFNHSVLIGGTTSDSTATKTLTMHNGTAPGASVSNAFQLHASSGKAMIYEDADRYIVQAASSTKTTAGAPYANDGYVELTINGTTYKFMTTA